MARASSSRPAWTESAPQQPCPRGTTTSYPSAESTRSVASFTPGKKTRCTQPPTSATRPRLVPAARAPAGRLEVTSPNPRSGASASRRPMKGRSRVRPVARVSQRSPVIRQSQRKTAATRSRPGCGKREKMAERRPASAEVRTPEASTRERASSMTAS